MPVGIGHGQRRGDAQFDLVAGVDARAGDDHLVVQRGASDGLVLVRRRYRPGIGRAPQRLPLLVDQADAAPALELLQLEQSGAEGGGVPLRQRAAAGLVHRGIDGAAAVGVGIGHALAQPIGQRARADARLRQHQLQAVPVVDLLGVGQCEHGQHQHRSRGQQVQRVPPRPEARGGRVVLGGGLRRTRCALKRHAQQQRRDRNEDPALQRGDDFAPGRVGDQPRQQPVRGDDPQCGPGGIEQRGAARRHGARHAAGKGAAAPASGCCAGSGASAWRAAICCSRS